MKALLLYPEHPVSFWSFQKIRRLSGRKGLFPPLSLLTVAALLPRDWELRLVDRNVHALRESDWNWADVVMISGMIPQKAAMLDLVRESRARGKPIVAGGPCVSAMPDEFRRAGCHFVVVGEGETTIPRLVAALERGEPGGVFECGERPDLASSPIPRYDLIRFDQYLDMTIQTSRGCPYECDFCDVIRLYGRVPRYKSPEQVVAELDHLHRLGYRGAVFICDDNFIGSRPHAKATLRAMTEWNLRRREPFGFLTQASINLGQDLEMIDLMTAANFGVVFIGIESPDEAALEHAGKSQNLRTSMVEAVHNIKRNGLTVFGSFMIGFDRELPGVADRIVRFVEETEIPIAMINLLQAAPNTPLWNRLRDEGRLVPERSTDVSIDTRLNFTPLRPEAEILSEFAEAWDRIYDPARFFPRVARYYSAMRPTRRAQAAAQGRRPEDGPRRRAAGRTGLAELRIAIFLILKEGVVASSRRQFWQSLLAVRRNNPSRLRSFLLRSAEGLSMQDMKAMVLRQRTRASSPPAVRA